nr:hypothetical protein [Tanacetum cinerariifolium]
MTTLAEFMILSGGDNRSPMLEKHRYDFWKSKMELYMQNREHGRMILESVKHDPLIWPTIEENEVTMTNKYIELSAAEKIQGDCDLMETNIILQGLPSDIYSLVNHHRVAKDLWERIQLLMQGTSLTKQERECKLFKHIFNNMNSMQMKSRLMRERNQDPLALSPQYRSIHPTQHLSTTYPSTPLVISYPTTSYPNAYSSTVHQDAYSQPQSIPQIEYTVSTVNQQTHLAEFPHIDSGLAVLMSKQRDDPIDAINKMMSFLSTVGDCLPVQERQNSYATAYQENDLDAYDSDCDDFSIAKVDLIANLSSYRSDVLSEVPHSENTHNDMLNQSVQEMTYSEQTHLVNYPENEITSDINIILILRICLKYKMRLFKIQILLHNKMP